jgi:hypothetical protein
LIRLTIQKEGVEQFLRRRDFAGIREGAMLPHLRFPFRRKRVQELLTPFLPLDRGPL